MDPNIARLHPYPFEKLTKLKFGITPPADKSPIALSIGEPKHRAPAFVLETLENTLGSITNYPITKGLDTLREAISQWATQRFQLSPNSLSAAEHILPVNGTREALFAFTQALFDRTKAGKKIIMPNPFYQIYEGAALLAGAEPHFLACSQENNYAPDFHAVTDDIWQQCQLLFICSPGNPTGNVLSLETLQHLITLADKHDFVIASDECYSELYFNEDAPPPGLLQACANMQRDDYHRCVVFHSLSKRSNLPGLRSGFIAGDKTLIQPFLKYRTYHGCAMPVFSQHASIAAWQDEVHVQENRALYREKFAAVLKELNGCLDVDMPDAGFYLWPRTGMGDEAFAQSLFASENITVLPGSYLGREDSGLNPGAGHVRMALVAPLDECIDAAQRIKHFIENLSA